MAKKAPSPYFTPSKNIWLEFYKSRQQEDYYFTGIDGRHLTQLINKVKAKLVARSMEPTTDNVANSLKMFLESITDRWQLENLELKNINSCWNSLYAKAVKNSSLGRAESIDEVIRRRNSQGASGG